jgi:hypothetical protein
MLPAAIFSCISSTYHLSAGPGRRRRSCSL